MFPSMVGAVENLKCAESETLELERAASQHDRALETYRDPEQHRRWNMLIGVGHNPRHVGGVFESRDVGEHRATNEILPLRWTLIGTGPLDPRRRYFPADRGPA